MTNQQDTALLPMDLAIALGFADNPRPYDTLQAPSDSKEELWEALGVVAAAYRAALEQAKPSASGEVERVARAIHEYLCRRDIVTYLDNDEDCEGIARAAIAALRANAPEPGK